MLTGLKCKGGTSLLISRFDFDIYNQILEQVKWDEWVKWVSIWGNSVWGNADESNNPRLGQIMLQIIGQLKKDSN